MKAQQRPAQVTIGIGWRRDRALDARPPLVDGRDLDLLPKPEQRNLTFPSGGLDDADRRRLCAGDGNTVGLQDAGLLGGDRLQRRTEVLRMVERDVRDDVDAEIEHVGGVEASTQADLADQQVDAGPREVVERGAGQDLELRRRAELGRYRTDGGLNFG